jgi:hypothetical protein
MNLINDVDKPGSDIEQYVSTLDKYLADKAEKINELRTKLKKFGMMLKDEETLSTKFLSTGNMFDVYEFGNKNNNNKNKNNNNYKYDNDNDDDDVLNLDLNSHFRK